MHRICSEAELFQPADFFQIICTNITNDIVTSGYSLFQETRVVHVRNSLSRIVPYNVLESLASIGCQHRFLPHSPKTHALQPHAQLNLRPQHLKKFSARYCYHVHFLSFLFSPTTFIFHCFHEIDWSFLPSAYCRMLRSSICLKLFLGRGCRSETA